MGESGAAATGDSAPPGDAPERWFVGLVGAALLAVLLGFVLRYAGDVPYWDDFEVVPVITGERPLDGAWLWEPASGHRAPLRRIAVVALHALTGHGFRAAAFLNALLLGAAAFLAAGAARRIRGRTSYADALFPVLLLDPGWAPSLLRAVLLTGFLRTALLAAILFMAAGLPGPAPGRSLRGIALAALGLSFCITTGMVLAIPLAAWAAWAVARLPAEVRERERAAVVAARFAVVGVLLHALLYFPGLRGGAEAPAAEAPSVGAAIALQALGQGFGPAGAFGWTQVRWESFGSGFPPVLSCAALVILVVPVALAALRFREPGDALRREGLAAVVVAVLLVAAATGAARGGMAGDFGLQNHYGATAAPGIAAGLLLLLRLLPRAGGEFLLAGFFAVACALCSFNLQVGHRICRERARGLRAFEADVRAGMDTARLAERHVPFLHGSAREIEPLLERMRAAGWPPFPPR